MRRGFEYKVGDECNVHSVLSYLGAKEDSQKLVSRAVKEVFPGVLVRREKKHGKKQYPMRINCQPLVVLFSLLCFVLEMAKMFLS